MAQQVLKLAAAAALEADVALLADSDVCLVRPVDADTFRRPGGRDHFNALPGAVDEAMPRHLLWHQVARRLLGLPPARPPLPDYVSALSVWQPAVVRALLARVESVTGRRWADAVGGCVHFSEFILYGVFVEEVLGRDGVAVSDDPLCHSYWLEDAPLDAAAAADFVAAAAATDVAVMISARSGTDTAVRRAVLSPGRSAPPG
jgi:hypothetical protein